MASTNLRIPENIKPKDGRFGCGPSLLRETQIERLSSVGKTLLGTSHRQSPIKSLVGKIQESLLEIFQAPDDYEIVLGNGGASAFWDIASFCLVEQKAQHASFGEFGQKFANATNNAPFLQPSQIIQAPAGDLALCQPSPDIDIYAYPHHETSTGVVSPVRNFASSNSEALTVVDGTSIAGGATFSVSEVDCYYFSPQKCLGSEGGLWLAMVNQKAVKRCQDLVSTRWVPEFLNLKVALDNSRKQQTLNTPAISTIVLLENQLDWILAQGGIETSAKHCQQATNKLYNWALASEVAKPFVENPNWRSPVIATIDFSPEVDAKILENILRTNGILDVNPYRKLGRNQLRIACFPNVSLDDVDSLLACLDYVLERLV